MLPIPVSCWWTPTRRGVTTGSKDYSTYDSLYTMLTADRKDAPRVLTECIQPSNWENDLHVLPASPLLESADRELIVSLMPLPFS
jgi:hypothetical protein